MYSYTLRPTFTKHIINRLQKGESINVYGSVDVDEYSCEGIGIGKSRLLEDIELVVKNSFKGVTVISIDMNRYRAGDSFDMFLKDISSPLSMKPYQSFANFIEATEDKKVFLLIDNFHYFFDNKNLDERFDATFIDNLNSASNKSNISILVTTHKPHTNYKLYIKDTQQTRASWLTFEGVCLSELAHDEFYVETKRRFSAFDDTELIAIANEINDTLCIATLKELEKQKTTKNSVYTLLKKTKKSVQKSCKQRFNKKSKLVTFLDNMFNKLKGLVTINIGNGS